MCRNRLIKRILPVILILSIVSLLWVLTVLLVRLFSHRQEDSLPLEVFAWQNDWQPLEGSFLDYSMSFPQAWERKLVLNDLYLLRVNASNYAGRSVHNQLDFGSILEELKESEPTEVVKYNIWFLETMLQLQQDRITELPFDSKERVDLEGNGKKETILIKRETTDDKIFEEIPVFQYEVLINGERIGDPVLNTDARFFLMRLGEKSVILCEHLGYSREWFEREVYDHVYGFQNGQGKDYGELVGYVSIVTPEGHFVVYGYRPHLLLDEGKKLVPKYSWTEYQLTENGLEYVPRSGWLTYGCICYISLIQDMPVYDKDGNVVIIPRLSDLINIAYSETGDLCVVSNTGVFGYLKCVYEEGNESPILLPGGREIEYYYLGEIEEYEWVEKGWYY